MAQVASGAVLVVGHDVARAVELFDRRGAVVEVGANCAGAVGLDGAQAVPALRAALPSG